MSNQYVRVPNPSDRHNNEIDDEVQAAFDYREDDDDDEHDSSESRPLNSNTSRATASNNLPPIQTTPHNQPGTYNFDSVDYDFPPPGSPPPLSATAFPNDIGNSNGYVPVFDGHSIRPPQRPWWKRAASSVLPSGVSDRLGWSTRPPGSVVGSGINNDGVFANVVAKPTAPVRIQNGDETYVVPEDSQPEAPPSYAQAQADAVPPYWETTVHAPFAPDAYGETIVDSLPTGSLFSFCWNMLVSISFQFVGFLLTYLLHTSHAARLGSRAGLGVTLIQYGFALRGRLEGSDDNDREYVWATLNSNNSTASIPTPAGIDGLPQSNSTMGMTDEQVAFLADATTEWLSFFLMTVGWFILLTSLLGFYRVKRWERGVLVSQQASQRHDSPVQTAATANSFMSGIEQNFSLNGMSRIELLRQGFGLRRGTDANNGPSSPASDQAIARAESEEAQPLVREDGTVASLTLDPNDPQSQRLIQVIRQEMRLRNSLRDAGFL